MAIETHQAQQQGQEQAGEDEKKETSTSLLDLVVERVNPCSIAEDCISAFREMNLTDPESFHRPRVVGLIKFWQEFSLFFGEWMCVCVCVCIYL
jgi:hypothetical protein